MRDLIATEGEEEKQNQLLEKFAKLKNVPIRNVLTRAAVRPVFTTALKTSDALQSSPLVAVTWLNKAMTIPGGDVSTRN